MPKISKLWWKKGGSWRTGLRWDSVIRRWRVAATNRLLTDAELAERKDYDKRRRELAKAKNPKSAIVSEMKERFKEAKSELQDKGYRVDYRVHENKDGTVDGELRVKPKRGQQVADIFIDFGDDLITVPDTWISSGVRYRPREDEEFYAKFQGMSQAQAYYQRNTPDKFATNLVTGQVIDEKMKERGRRKAEQVFVRLNWNPQGEQPEIPAKREKQKTRKKRRK